MKNKIVALIPVREGSKRVKGKNFRNFFNGLSIFDIKINQLKESKLLNDIYVSSDSLKVKKLCKSKKVKFLKRAPKYCKDHNYPWYEIHNSILDKIPGNPYVAWCLTTSPTFSRFDDAFKIFIKNKERYDSLVGVLQSKNFILDKNGKSKNFNPGMWHPYSQELENNYFITGSIFLARKNDMLKWNYWFGRRPFLFKLNKIESIDIDEPEDFNLGKIIYKNEYFNNRRSKR
jgi:CMP-N-acetylneuraminic acid synthetase